MPHDRQFTARVNRVDLLKTLKENRDRHVEMFAESIEGFRRYATAVLRQKLDEVACGKITNLSMHLNPPEDHSKEYNTAIQMMEWSEEETIELTANEFRNLVMDEWDWMGVWLVSNRGYSPSVRSYSNEKSHLVRE
jgi:hypothetical protein